MSKGKPKKPIKHTPGYSFMRSSNSVDFFNGAKRVGVVQMIQKEGRKVGYGRF